MQYICGIMGKHNRLHVWHTSLCRVMHAWHTNLCRVMQGMPWRTYYKCYPNMMTIRERVRVRTRRGARVRVKTRVRIG